MMFRVIVLSAMLLMSFATLQAQSPLKISMADYEPWLQERLLSLEVGDSRDVVLDKMGGIQTLLVRGFGVKDRMPSPYSSDKFTLEEGVTAEILWFKTWEKEKAMRYSYGYTPVVLQDRQLIGQGLGFAQTFAGEHGLKIDLP